MSEQVRPPWTVEQVTTLNLFQASGQFHPFTCANRGDGKHVQRSDSDLGELIATADGWICLDCHYTQDWAHAAMADPAFVRPARNGANR